MQLHYLKITFYTFSTPSLPVFNYQYLPVTPIVNYHYSKKIHQTPILMLYIKMP